MVQELESNVFQAKYVSSDWLTVFRRAHLGFEELVAQHVRQLSRANTSST